MNTLGTTEQIRDQLGSLASFVRVNGDSPDVRFDKASAILFTLIAVVYVIARAWQLTAFGLYADETFTVYIARADWQTLTDNVIADVVHPPLFYYVLKLWMLVGGESLVWLKLFPFLTSIAIIAPFYLLCRELRMKPQAINLALWLMAVNNFLVFYAQELRMYDLLLLFALTSLWLFAKLINRSANEKPIELALFAVNLLLVYTHYYGWLIVGVEFLLLLILKRDRLMWFTVALALLIACFTPWALLVAGASAQKGGLAPNLGWNRAPTPEKFLWFYTITSGAIDGRLQALSPFFTVFVRAVGLLIILSWIPIALWTRRIITQRKAIEKDRLNAFWFLAALAFLPAVASFIVSHTLSQSVWSNRYLIISAPVFLMLQAIAFTSIERTHWTRIATASLIAITSVSGFVQMYYCDRVSFEPLVNRLIQAAPARDDVTKVFTSHINCGNTIQFYLDKAGEKKLQVHTVSNYTQPDEDFFYVAFVKYLPEEQKKIESEIIPRGFVMGEPIKAHGPTYEIVLVPVYRHENSLKNVRIEY